MIQAELFRYCSFVYSALASFRMGRSESAPFHKLKKSWYAARGTDLQGNSPSFTDNRSSRRSRQLLVGFLQHNDVRSIARAHYSQGLAVR